MRLATYIAQFLIDHGVTDVFSVVGGGAMHLNDALGHADGLRVTYNHHEQACAMAAEAYARLEGRIAAVCVTTGPGGTNALTGVLCGWLDSIPMLILSGQVRSDTTTAYARRVAGAQVRSVGDQEYEIVPVAQNMTKYACMLEAPEQIRYALEKAWHLATSGRPGPVWIDIPLDLQAAEIEPDALDPYDPTTDDALLPPPVSEEQMRIVVTKLQQAKRPVLYAGYGIRLSGGYEVFRKVIEAWQIPVVTYWNAIDLLEDEHPLYVGRAGNMGDRPGNWAVQNADLVLAVGTRLSIRQVGYHWETWAREAEVIQVDIDPEEMKKHTLHVDLPIHADAKDFLEKLAEAEKKNDAVQTAANTAWEPWRVTCQNWKMTYPVVQPKHRKESRKPVNIYAFLDCLSRRLPAGSLTAVSNGACCVAGHQAFVIKQGSRFINNNAVAAMGYGLPAAIGLCLAGERRNTICLEGDGSLMMNLQELQTVATHRLPIKLFLINNKGYQSIRITQTNVFPDRSKVGIGPDSNDLSFPEYEKIAAAFGLPYHSARSNAELPAAIEKAMQTEGPVFVEIFTDTDQVWEPKNGARKRADGSLYSPPLEDLEPFLPREELEAQMVIPLLPEDEQGADRKKEKS